MTISLVVDDADAVCLETSLSFGDVTGDDLVREIVGGSALEDCALSLVSKDGLDDLATGFVSGDLGFGITSPGEGPIRIGLTDISCLV